MVQKRQRARMTEIAVIDNGEGMTSEVLTMALEFGNGMRLADRSGIGRFGMGLPNASISQCRRLDVWTWQAGPDNAVHSYLDVDDIRSEERRVGKSVSVRVDLGGRRIIKKKITNDINP